MAAFQKAIDATDRTTSLSFTDSSQSIQVAVGDLSGVSISVSGTWTGSLSFEGSVSGTTWSAIKVYLLSNNSESATITATGQYGINPTPFSQIRIVPAVASGSVLVELLAVKTSSFNWLSAVWKQLTDKLPALSNGKIPVEVGSLNVTVGNASLEIANDVGNPVPISAANLPLPTNAATSANQTTGNTSLASIDTKTPALGQALAAVSTPVVLPASQITALTPPTSVAINNAITLAAETGYLSYRNTALTNAAVQVKASGGSVMGWNFINVNSVTVYVKFYNLATGVTVGTSPILLTQAVPGGSDSNPGINFLEASLIPQEVFSTGISMVCVTGLADNSTTAPTTPIHVSVRYK